MNPRPAPPLAAPTGAATFEIPPDECVELIGGEPFGRICILEHGVPIALPVNYKVTREGGHVAIVVRTAPETAVGRYRGAAALQVDRVRLDEGRAWSVIVRGDLRSLPGEPPPTDPEPFVRAGRTRWMLLDARTITGRRFLVRRGGEYSVEWQMEPA